MLNVLYFGMFLEGRVNNVSTRMNKIALKIIGQLFQRRVTAARNTDVFCRDCSLSVACSCLMIKRLLTDCIVPFKDYQIFGLTSI